MCDAMKVLHLDLDPLHPTTTGPLAENAWRAIRAAGFRIKAYSKRQVSKRYRTACQVALDNEIGAVLRVRNRLMGHRLGGNGADVIDKYGKAHDGPTIEAIVEFDRLMHGGE